MNMANVCSSFVELIAGAGGATRKAGRPPFDGGVEPPDGGGSGLEFGSEDGGVESIAAPCLIETETKDNAASVVLTRFYAE